MLQGQFLLLYRAYQGEPVMVQQEGEQTVVLDQFRRTMVRSNLERTGGQIRAVYYMEQGTRTTAWAISQGDLSKGRTLSLIELEEDSVLRSSCVPAIL